MNIKSYSKYSVITIQNWEEYQDLNNRRTTAEQQLNNRRTTADHKQEGKEGKEGREVKDYVETVEKKQSLSASKNKSIFLELKPNWITTEDWADIMEIRKNKKATMTEGLEWKMGI